VDSIYGYELNGKNPTKNEKSFFNFDTKKLILFHIEEISVFLFPTIKKALRRIIDGNYNTNIVKILIKKIIM